MKSKILVISVAVAALLLNTGCSNKNILMPGKYQSDCEKDGGAYGMCGSPKNIYKYQSNIDQVDMSGDDSYHIDDNGNIQKIVDGELVGDPKLKANLNSTDSTVIGKNNDLVVKNRTYMLSNKPKSSIIRSMEVIKRVWLNTYKDSFNNLIGEHDIYVVTKEAEWNVGEKTPANVKKVKMIPSIVAKEAIIESHSTAPLKDDAIIREYLK